MVKNKKTKVSIVGKRQTHEINREILLQKIENNPGLKLSVGQILLLFSDYTANQLKHFRSKSYKGNDAPPCDARHGRPKYIYNQFYAWHNKVIKEENTADKTAKTANAVRSV